MLITHYTVLGVPENAAMSEIKTAYRQKAMMCHPDRNSVDSENHNLFVRINDAYLVLSDDNKRKNYDYKLSEYKERQYQERERTDHYQREATNASQNKQEEPNNSKKSNAFISFLAKVVGVFSLIILLLLRFWAITLIGLFAIFSPKGCESDNNKENVSSPQISNYQLPLGSMPYKSTYGNGYFDSNSLSSVEVKNGVETDALVMLYNVRKDRVYRHAYITSNSTFEFENIPEGIYDMKVYYGNNWNRGKDNGNGNPKGGFDYNESYTHSNSSDYFRIIFTEDYDGISYPTYTVTLYQVRSGNMQTEKMSKVDFFN